MIFNVLNQHIISSWCICICFYKQMCFCPSTQLYLSGFFVIGSKYAYNNLLPNCGFAIYIQMKCTVYPVCFGLLSATCEAISAEHGLNCNILSRENSKTCTLKITTFWSTHSPSRCKYFFGQMRNPIILLSMVFS